jgi:hypothetical protein
MHHHSIRLYSGRTGERVSSSDRKFAYMLLRAGYRSCRIPVVRMLTAVVMDAVDVLTFQRE